jgi:hypothetical protein
LTLASQGNYVSGKHVYLWVKDNENHDTGWVQSVDWSLPSANQPPAVLSGTPSNATVSPQTFTFVARDPDGAADISTVYWLVNGNSSIPQQTCHGFYVRATNALYLYNDTLTGVLGPLIPGSSATLQNSQCVVSGNGSSAAASGTDLILKLTLGSQGNYVNGKNVYIWVKDNANHDTGWIQTSAWSIPTANQPPSVLRGRRLT